MWAIDSMVICVCLGICIIVFFKQKTAYEMRISDWSSDVCSSDLAAAERLGVLGQHQRGRIERRLHGGAHRSGAAVVDRGAHGADQRDEAEREHRRDATRPDKSRVGKE